MKSYTKEESDFLIKFYSELMIGKIGWEGINSKITQLTAEELIDKTYMIKVHCSVDTNLLLKPFGWLDNVAKQLNLISPEDVLRERGRQK